MKPIKRLRLRVPNDPAKRWFWVLVFSNKREMWDYRAERCRQAGIVEEAYGTFGAMVCPWALIRIDAEGNEETHPSIGEVLLHKQALGCGLISHEMLHCAMHVFRLRHENATFETDGCGDGEEELADLVGEFTRHLVDKLYKHKLVQV